MVRKSRWPQSICRYTAVALILLVSTTRVQTITGFYQGHGYIRLLCGVLFILAGFSALKTPALRP